jgi:uncharacterized coiled-coil protein SlyX
MTDRQRVALTAEATSGDGPDDIGCPGDLSARLPTVDDKRLTEIEMRYTYLERLVDDLSRVLHEQQRYIDGMSGRLNRLETSVADALDQSHERPPEEKPPHY